MNTTDKLTVLLIEDDEVFADLLCRQLACTDLTHAVCLKDAVANLGERSYDIVLTDLALPDADGMQSVKIIRQYAPALPVVVLTSAESEATALQALKCGAQEYAVKGSASRNHLLTLMSHAIERQKLTVDNTRLIAELKAQQSVLDRKNKRLQRLVATAHRFVDNVSHEFRTPLTVIREYASLIRDEVIGEVNDQQREFLDVVRYRVDDLNVMVDDMLDSSKLEAGLLGIHRQVVDPVEVVRRPLQGLELKARVRGVELVVDAPNDLPGIFCDPEKIGRVVTNLVTNAIKFCPEGTGRIAVRLEHCPDASEVRCRVTDNGPGIDPEDIKLLFERFRQVGTSTQSSTKGFGLGLNIARELVDQNFGQITVESEVEKGTTFTFSVPVDDWHEIVRRFSTHLVRTDEDASVVLVVVQIEGEVTPEREAEIDAFWRFTERQPDLIRRTGPGSWTLLLATSEDLIGKIFERFEENHAMVNRNRISPLPDLRFDVLGSFPAAATDRLVAAACAEPDQHVSPSSRLLDFIRGSQSVTID